MATLALVVSPLAAGCASPTESARAYTYGYDGAGQQYRYEAENVPSEWEPLEEGDAAPYESAPPAAYADDDDSKYQSEYVYRGGRDPRTDKAPNWSDVRPRS